MSVCIRDMQYKNNFVILCAAREWKSAVIISHPKPHKTIYPHYMSHNTVSSRQRFLLMVSQCLTCLVRELPHLDV